MIDEFLNNFGLKIEDLNAEEKKWFFDKVNAFEQGQITLEKLKDIIKDMRTRIEDELTNTKDTPQNFITLLTYLIPVIGLIRKWYHDQRELELKARLKVLISIEFLLTSPEKQRKEIEQALSNIAGGVG